MVHRKKESQMRWFRNGDGHDDPVLTMAWIGFIVIISRVLVSGLKIHVWGQQLDFSPVDSGLVAAILTPTLGAYVGNHYSNMKNNPFYIKRRMDIDGDGKEEDVVIAPDPDKKA